MRQRHNLAVVPVVVPKAYCECGRPLYDGRVKKCSACKAAIAKTTKRAYNKKNYALQEAVLAELQELEDGMKIIEWALLETKKRVTQLRIELTKL